VRGTVAHRGDRATGDVANNMLRELARYSRYQAAHSRGDRNGSYRERVRDRRAFERREPDKRERRREREKEREREGGRTRERERERERARAEEPAARARDPYGDALRSIEDEQHDFEL